jgi:hypothetical protein
MVRLPSLSFGAANRLRLLGAARSPVAQAAMLALCAAAVLALGFVGLRWIQLGDQVQQRLQAWESSRRPMPVLRSSTAAPALKPAERTRINDIVRRLNTPWPAVFGVLEQAASDDVALLSIEPDVERGAIRVLAEGRSLDALLAHAQRMQQSPAVAHVRLLRIEKDSAGPDSAVPRLGFDVVLVR